MKTPRYMNRSMGSGPIDINNLRPEPLPPLPTLRGTALLVIVVVVLLLVT